MKLIVDSGSTKTNWALLSKTEKKIFATVGINLHYQSEKEILKILKEAKEAFVSELKIEGNILDSIHFYGAGISNIQKSAAMGHLLQTIFGKIGNIEVKSDLEGAAIALFGNQKGLACILGTGLGSGVFNGNKITDQVPSLGFWLGDEGSGADLGRRLIKAYLRNEMGDSLMKKFGEEFGKIERHEVFEEMANRDRPNSYFGTFTPFLSENLKEPFISKLLQKAFEEFTDRNLMRYEISSSLPLGIVGSVGYYFQDALKQIIARYLDNKIIFIKDPMPNLLLFHKP